MPKLPVKAAPLALLVQAAMVAKNHWEALKPADRAELTRILKASGGRPGNLGPRDRNELRDLLRKLDLAGLGRDLAPLASKHRAGRR